MAEVIKMPGAIRLLWTRGDTDREAILSAISRRGVDDISSHRTKFEAGYGNSTQRGGDKVMRRGAEMSPVAPGWGQMAKMFRYAV